MDLKMGGATFGGGRTKGKGLGDALKGKNNKFDFGGGNSEFLDDRSDFSRGSRRSDWMNDFKMNNIKFRQKDTISELYDEADKDAIFMSSMKRGGAMHGFNMNKFLNQSPGKGSLGQGLSPEKSLDGTFGVGFGQQKNFAPLQATITPADTKAVAALQGGLNKENKKPTQGFVGNRDHPKPVMAEAFRRQPPTEFVTNQQPNIPKQYFKPSPGQNQDPQMKQAEFAELNGRFGLKTKTTQVCKKHRQTPVEFYDFVSNEFVCRICAGNAKDHEYQPIAEVASQVQDTITDLKHTYLTKRMHIYDRLVQHQNKIEDFFHIYYDALDKSRREMLNQEYEIRDQMDQFENQMKRLLNRAQNMSTVEFFHEQYEIKDQIAVMAKHVTNFQTYIPKVKLKLDDERDTTRRIQDFVKSKLEENLQIVDNSFSLENLEYVQTELNNPMISEIYKLLGPFDYNLYSPEDEEDDKDKLNIGDNDSNADDEEGRMMQDEWMPRRSGATYRGEVQIFNKRPDGKGIKVYKGKSLYEGYFANGTCHGYGRGITSNGEVYQGCFQDDMMEGPGFFAWPDGRIFEGEYLNSKKHGKGKFFEANGQVYEGDFKNDLCNGFGILYYPDGKRFEGNWREGKKNGKGTYVFPNGASYRVVYTDGQKKSSGQLMSDGVNMDQLKDEYRSLAKKSQYAKDFLKQNTHMKAVSKKKREMGDDDVMNLMNPNADRNRGYDDKGKLNDKFSGKERMSDRLDRGGAFASPGGQSLNQDLARW